MTRASNLTHMAMKGYSPAHYFWSGAIALTLGLANTVAAFDPYFGPGFLVAGVVFFALGWKKQRSRSRAPRAQGPA